MKNALAIQTEAYKKPHREQANTLVGALEGDTLLGTGERVHLDLRIPSRPRVLCVCAVVIDRLHALPHAALQTGHDIPMLLFSPVTSALTPTPIAVLRHSSSTSEV